MRIRRFMILLTVCIKITGVRDMQRKSRRECLIMPEDRGRKKLQGTDVVMKDYQYEILL